MCTFSKKLHALLKNACKNFYLKNSFNQIWMKILSIIFRGVLFFLFFLGGVIFLEYPILDGLKFYLFSLIHYFYSLKQFLKNLVISNLFKLNAQIQ
jgi:hypothetical protein